MIKPDENQKMRYIAQDKKNAQALLDKGISEYNAGNFKAAIDAYRRALRISIEIPRSQRKSITISQWHIQPKKIFPNGY